MSEDLQPKKKSNGGYIAVILILLVGLGVMGYLWSSKNSSLNDCKNDNAELQADMEGMNEMLSGYVGNMSNDLKTDFKNMLATYDALAEKDASKAAEIEEQKAKIADLLDQVERGKMTAHQLFLMRKENETLRKIMKGYVVQIDSLNTLNLQLTSTLDETTNQLNSTTAERDELQNIADEQSAQLDKAKILKAYSVSAMALKSKLGGKMGETTKARNAKQIVTNLTIGENPTATAGSKTVYMRITDPSGKTLQHRTSNLVETISGQVPYSDKKTINYTNQAIDVAVYFDINDIELAKGNYKVKIYCEGQLIGNDSFTLK